jgi:hypothetical protein
MKTALGEDLVGLLTDCDGQDTGYSNNITAAMFAVAAALRGSGSMSEGQQPVSHAIYDIARAIADKDGPDMHVLSDAISAAGQDIHDGLVAVAKAIRESREP